MLHSRQSGGKRGCIAAVASLTIPRVAAVGSLNAQDSHSGLTLILYVVAACFALIALLFLARTLFRFWHTQPLRPPAIPQDLTELLPVVVLAAPLQESRLASDSAAEQPRFVFSRPAPAKTVLPALPMPPAVQPTAPAGEPPLSARSNVSVGMMRSARISYRQAKN